MTGPAALWVTGVNEPGRPAKGGRGVQHEGDVYAWMTPQIDTLRLTWKHKSSGEGGKAANTWPGASRTLFPAKRDSGKLGDPMSHCPGTVTI